MIVPLLSYKAEKEGGRVAEISNRKRKAYELQSKPKWTQKETAKGTVVSEWSQEGIQYFYRYIAVVHYDRASEWSRDVEDGLREMWLTEAEQKVGSGGIRMRENLNTKTGPTLGVLVEGEGSEAANEAIISAYLQQCNPEDLVYMRNKGILPPLPASDGAAQGTSAATSQSLSDGSNAAGPDTNGGVGMDNESDSDDSSSIPVARPIGTTIATAGGRQNPSTAGMLESNILSGSTRRRGGRTGNS